MRSTNCNDLCLVEVGFPALQNLVQQKQKEFFMKLLQERKGMNDDPFLAAFKLAKDNGMALYFYIDKLMENKNNLIQESLSELKRKVTTSDRSKIITYRHLNPTLEKCNLYNLEIPELVNAGLITICTNYSTKGLFMCNILELYPTVSEKTFNCLNIYLSMLKLSWLIFGCSCK